ncbi:MAG: c-type cytochrome [Candidatus Contendobacter sp.]|nr:c-type cytochrome [Candidatus Contendobacter sp.]MDS4056989.1 c-type cytochrome [Candidatus Contendobacter sp.]
MKKQWIRPLTVIAIVWSLEGSLGVIKPASGFLTLLIPTALAQDNSQYAAKPTGWDGPAGSCVVCHNLAKGASWRVAPNLWGIVGAPKADAKGYGYSLALAQAGGTWTAKELDEYLANPNRFLPGTNKTISVTDPEERARIVKFLGTLKD